MTKPAVASADSCPSRYPSPPQATTAVLRNGSVIGVRALHPNDEPALREFLRGLSQQSRRLRFFGLLGDEALMREAHRETHVEETRGLGLVATADGVRGDHAEVSFAIADDVMLLYLESFGNPRRFSRIAGRVARRKPIVAVKSGRSLAGARAAGSQYREAIRLVGSDPAVDALVVIFIPPLVTKTDDVARAIVDGVRALGGSKPVLTVFMQSRGVPPELRAADVRVPSYAFPENAAIALSRVARYGAWRARPPVPPLQFADVRRDAAAALVATALGRGDEWLAPDDVWALLSCYGLPLLAQAVVGTADEAATAAAGLGSDRVAIKAVVPGLVHKTEAGAVRLSLRPDEVGSAARDMATRLHLQDTPGGRFLVQSRTSLRSPSSI
jgi:acyl-CoA synthetase (NDP forming)